jgi:acetyl esterase/lipase
MIQAGAINSAAPASFCDDYLPIRCVGTIHTMPEAQIKDHGPAIGEDCSSDNPGPFDPVLAQLDKRIGNLVVNRFTYRIFRILGRLTRPAFHADGVTVEHDTQTGTHIAIIRPVERCGNGALMLFHGGGFVLGEPADLFQKAALFAKRLGVPVMCPAYRLAPEAPYPAGIDDAYSAWQKIIDAAAAMAIDPAKIVVGGYSAGAGLAASLIHRLRDEGGIQPAAQLLIYPMLDDRTAQRRAIDKPRHRVWSNRNNRFAWKSYLGPEARPEKLKYAAAARQADLAGLPPAWLGVGTCDLFLDEVREYRSRLAAAGTDVVYEEIAGAIHGFDMDDNTLGHAFTEMQLEFVRRYVS